MHFKLNIERPLEIVNDLLVTTEDLKKGKISLPEIEDMPEPGYYAWEYLAQEAENEKNDN